MNMRDYPTIHFYKDTNSNISNRAFIAVLHFTLTVGSSAMRITFTIIEL